MLIFHSYERKQFNSFESFRHWTYNRPIFNELDGILFSIDYHPQALSNINLLTLFTKWNSVLIQCISASLQLVRYYIGMLKTISQALSNSKQYPNKYIAILRLNNFKANLSLTCHWNTMKGSELVIYTNTLSKANVLIIDLEATNILSYREGLKYKLVEPIFSLSNLPLLPRLEIMSALYRISTSFAQMIPISLIIDLFVMVRYVSISFLLALSMLNLSDSCPLKLFFQLFIYFGDNSKFVLPNFQLLLQLAAFAIIRFIFLLHILISQL